jgi:hypothetical protein
MRRALRTLGLLACVAAFLACESDVPTAAERAAITPLVHTYLVKLATAYSEMDPRPLEGVGAPRLIDQARRDIELLRAGGDRLAPTLISVEVTDLKVLRHANAYVACTEVWDTRRFDAVTGKLVGHDPHSVLHSHIQLKLLDDSWKVLFREVEETRRGPRLTMPTPGSG